MPFSVSSPLQRDSGARAAGNFIFSPLAFLLPNDARLFELKDVIGGMRMIVWFARIAAWLDDKDLACEHLARASRLPGGVSYGELKLLPWWDPLRGDPCFEQTVASLAPK